MEGVYYGSGLKFQCQRCSACCRGEPGYVFLQAGDVERLSARLGLSAGEFLDAHCRVVDLGIERLYSLKEKRNHDCVFWDSGCAVYEDRPIQCRTYPFWAQIVESEASWTAESSSCPGIGKGKTFTRQEIEERLFQRRRSKPLGPER